MKLTSWGIHCRSSEDHKADEGDNANDEDADDKVYLFLDDSLSSFHSVSSDLKSVIIS